MHPFNHCTNLPQIDTGKDVRIMKHQDMCSLSRSMWASLDLSIPSLDTAVLLAYSPTVHEQRLSSLIGAQLPNWLC